MPFLGNNRPILTRFDDSVVRLIQVDEADEKPVYAIQFLRRARGYAPVPVSVAAEGVAPAEGIIFAAGPEQKNTFTLLRGTDGFVSQHIGDVENAETYDAWLATKDRFESLFEMTPTAVACDLHPEYLTSKWAHHQGLPVTEVQHHHSHIVSVMAEHGLTDAVCGIAFDGTGYGEDGAIWGGEVLLANHQAFERFANFDLRAPCPEELRPSSIRCAWPTACCGLTTCWNILLLRRLWRLWAMRPRCATP
mgnify:CR=1 FL=1